MKRILLSIICGALASCHLHGQTGPVVGTISSFKADSAEIEVKPDGGSPVAFKVTGDTVAQKVAPGVSDLKTARDIKVTDVHLGDRVLATPEPGTSNLRRLLVMNASEIRSKDAADRADWDKRGVNGIVSAKNGNELTLKMRSLTGDTQMTVTVTNKTRYKRYAPDSVKFADAKKSKLDEIAVGDQVRARGEKSADGLKVSAEDVVFGSFVSKAGAILSVDVAAKEISIKDAVSGKPLTVRFTADSQIKRMLDREGMVKMMHGSQAPPPQAHEGEHSAKAMPPAMMSLNEMLEHLPAAKLEDLKAGDIVVLASTKSAKPDHVTAISMLSNAEMLLQVMASMGPRNPGVQPSAATSLEALSNMGFGVMQ